MRALILLAVLAIGVAAQDPAEGWLSYATASCPNGERLTKFTGRWTVPQNPQPSDAFFSPWIGMDPADNLNLLQPVNPWLGDAWAIYTEYYQWSDGSNTNSAQENANGGDKLLGTITYDGEDKQSYTIVQHDLTSYATSHMTIPVQKNDNGQYKNYSIAYVVFEKTAYCGDYPPEEEILFTNLTMECNGKPFTPKWTTAYVEDCCSFRAHVVDPKTIKMTWTTSGDSLPKEKIEAQYAKNRQMVAARKAAHAKKGSMRAGAIHADAEHPPKKLN